MQFKRNLLIYVLIIFSLAVGALVYFFIFKKLAEQSPLVPSEEKTIEEILKDLTVPAAGEKPEISKETIQSLTASRKGEASEEVLKSLTP